MQNLGEFLKECSRVHRDRIAYEIKRGFRTQRFSFREVYELASKTATFLKLKGLKKGDRLAIWSGNCPEYPVLYFGCWLLGVVTVPIDIRTTQESIRIFLEKANCKIGFKSKFVPGDFPKITKHKFYLEDLVNLVSHLPCIHSDHLEGVRINDLAEIAFTSGTTGTPKGVVLTHGNFLSNIDALTRSFPFKKEYRTLSLLPLSHAFEQTADFLALYKTGIKVTYLERTNRLTIIKALRKNKITSVALVPQALSLLINGIEQQVEKQGKESLWKILNKIAPFLPIPVRRLMFRQVHKQLGGKLLFFGCGSAPLNLKLAQKWENLGIQVFEGYGASETTAVLTINTPKTKKLGSVGKALPGIKLRIYTDVRSQPTPDVKHVRTSGYHGGVGEIMAKGPNISLGYFEDEEKTKVTFRDGWYHTGDIGQFDKDGFLYITGREAFRIVLANGQKVYPEDIEKKLNAHPFVTESCVVGLKKEEGEVVHAVVITKYPKKLSEIIRDTNQKLASHEQIMEYSLWKEEDFPRTPILKIDRKKVASTLASHPDPDLSGKGSSVISHTQDKLISLISLVTKTAQSKIKENLSLATDLKLDSLQRVELLSLIEQEFAVAISETAINPQTTVEVLRTLIKESPIAPEETKITEWNYNHISAKIRTFLQDFFAFPIHALFAPIKVIGKENLRNIQKPCIFYFNHIGIMDGLCVLRVLSKEIREKLVIAVNSDIWQDYRKNWVQFLGGGFPFDKKKKIKASLETTGEFLDKGFSVLLAPEGTFSKDGTLMEFKKGIGFIAVEMQVPVVPIKIDPAYREIFPPMGKLFLENLPKKRKKIWIKIGKPMSFLKNVSYEEASKKMRQVLEAL